MVTRREETKKENKKTLDKLHTTRPREIRNYKLGKNWSRIMEVGEQ